MTEVSAETFMARLKYDPASGVFTWRMRNIEEFATPGVAKKWNSQYGGKQAGKVCKDGYISIRMMGRDFLAHRVAFAMMGEIVPDVVDHINRERSDNRFENLRPSDASLNGRNRKTDIRNTSGCPGVVHVKRTGKWQAQVGVNGRYEYLGDFASKDEAIAASMGRRAELGFYIPANLISVK